MATVKFRERCAAECTRDVIFLLQWQGKYQRDHWSTDAVFLSREEAEEYRAAHAYRWHKSRVYGVCAEGELAELIKNT